MPQAAPWPDRGSLDLGDYWALTGDAGILEGSIIRDDFGNWYLRGGVGIGLPGWPSLSRGDILIDTDPSERFTFEDLVDIDEMPLSDAEKAILARERMSGASSTFSLTYWLGFGVAFAPTSPHNVTVEGSFTRGTGGSATRSWTIPIWSAK